MPASAPRAAAAQRLLLRRREIEVLLQRLSGADSQVLITTSLAAERSNSMDEETARLSRNIDDDEERGFDGVSSSGTKDG